MKSLGIIKIIMVHHPGNMNVFTEFHGVLFKMCQNVLFRMTNLNQLVGLKMNSKVILIHSQGTMNVSRKCCANPSNC